MRDDDRCDKCLENLMYGASGYVMGACCACNLILCAECYNLHMVERHGAPPGYDVAKEAGWTE